MCLSCHHSRNQQLICWSKIIPKCIVWPQSLATCIEKTKGYHATWAYGSKSKMHGMGRILMQTCSHNLQLLPLCCDGANVAIMLSGVAIPELPFWIAFDVFCHVLSWQGQSRETIHWSQLLPSHKTHASGEGKWQGNPHSFLSSQQVQKLQSEVHQLGAFPQFLGLQSDFASARHESQHRCVRHVGSSWRCGWA